MPDPTDRVRETARSVVARLFDRDQDWHSLTPEERLERLPKDMSIEDLERHALQFRVEADVLRSLGKGFPGFVFDGAATPFSLSLLLFPFAVPFAGTAIPADRRPFFVDRFFFLVEPEIDRLDQLYELDGFARLSPDEAERTFSERAGASLALRIANAGATDDDAGLRAGALNLPPTNGAPAASATGCQFTVDTNTHGLQVFWSGAYYITPHFFGGPTTPATGMLQSGTYVFGVRGGAYTSIQWDRAAVCSLPGSPSVYLNY